MEGCFRFCVVLSIQIILFQCYKELCNMKTGGMIPEHFQSFLDEIAYLDPFQSGFGSGYGTRRDCVGCLGRWLTLGTEQ